MRTFRLGLPNDLHRQFKVAAAKEGCTMHEFVLLAILKQIAKSNGSNGLSFIDEDGTERIIKIKEEEELPDFS